MTTRRTIRAGFVAITVAAVALQVLPRAQQAQSVNSEGVPRTSNAGQTSTLLADGRWLLVGGEQTENAAVIWNPQTGVATSTGPLQQPRAWHTATVLADGRVLVFGGRRDGFVVGDAEVFDPTTATFSRLETSGAFPRADHTATLLIDGRLIVTGGTDGNPSALPSEVWTIQPGAASAIAFNAVAAAHQQATLLADGRVLVTGGRGLAGAAPPAPAVVDPRTMSISPVTGAGDLLSGTPIVADSLPANASADAPLDGPIALRFSTPAVPASLTSETLVLTSPRDRVPVRVIPAEQGRLAFLWPLDRLEPNTTYEVTVSGVADSRGVPFAPALITFTTVADAREAHAPDQPDEEWTPDARSQRNGWRTERPPSTWETLAPLTAPPGVTAISGRVLTLDGRPLPDVTLEVSGEGEARSDRTGRFLLTLKTSHPGRRVLEIDGKTASRPNRQYGFFEYGLNVTAGMTNILPFTIWMPKLDTAHQVMIASPTTREVVVTTPTIPGLELHLPPGTTITGEDGKPVTRIGITAIPVDRPPFPLARNVKVPVYFTIQPGGAYVATAGAGPKGAWLVYPNYGRSPADTRVEFFHYDPDVRDWYVYGLGRVTPSGAQVQPDPTTRIYALTGAMINSNPSPPNDGPPPGDCPCANDGDPVNLATGLFTLEATDVSLPDLIPIALTRTYRQRDTADRPFGIGTTHAYAMFLWSITNYTQADLVLPDGARIHYVRTSPGTSYPEAVYVHQESATSSATPTGFYKSKITWNGDGWDLMLKDGTTYVFGENAPLQAIRDRYGNTLRIQYSNGQTGNITQITSPNGRWVKFTYENNHVKTATDNIGRVVTYGYDASGRLTSVTDPENHVTSYTYDAGHRMLTVKPPSLQGTTSNLVTNEYDTTGDPSSNPTYGWVTKQTHVDGGIYRFAYTFTNGKISRTDVTDPTNHVRRVSFNENGYLTSDVHAYGETGAETTTSDRQAGTNFVGSSINSHGDVTTTTYDGLGNVQTVTRLPGTADEATTTYTYDPVFNQVATITDPLNHTTTFEYDAQGNRKSVTDALTHKTSFTYNTSGQVTSVTDPLQHTTTYDYAGPDLITITDPLSRVARRFFDAAGRLLSQTDPLGQTTRFAYDKVNHVTQVIDAMGNATAYGYDTPGRLQTVTDAQTHATTYGYDQFDRLASRTDPLGKAEAFTYDLLGHPSQRTDRKGQPTTRTYDLLNRLHQISYADNSTITYTYDSGNRLTQIDDSLNGQITRTYDNLDRLTSETTPQGTINYTYDKMDRRATMTVTGQPTVTYGYDDANRLTSITQGTSVVTITYDDADRRSTLTLPNGILTTYGYDNANQLTSLTYTLGQTTLGTLTYTYDFAGRRTQVGGTWARTGLPESVASSTYDATNRLTEWAGKIYSYDSNGNLASDGLTSYSWDARNQLVGISGGTSASFTYDASGRRAGKTFGGATTNFLYDQLNTVQELSGSTPTANLLTGDIDEVFQRAETAGTAILLTDALGSTIALTDSTALVQAGNTYSPFGETTTTGASASNPTQYTGREYDSTTGLYYYRARYYSPSHARFASEDPLKPNDGWSLYVYGDDAPIDNSDPSGLFTTTKQRAGNTVVCDGKGGLTIQLLTITDPCLIDCARRHELSHVLDIRSRNPGICVGQARGTGIAPSDDAERKWTEIRASQEEINCLKRKLKDNCGANCRASIEARIKQMEQYRDSFK